MDKNEALGILEIASDLSDLDIVYQVKQQLKGLHNNETQKLSKKIEACKILTDGQPGQAEIFSNFVISIIKNNKPDFLELLLKTVKNDEKFNYLNTEGIDGKTPLNFALEDRSKEVKVISLLLEHGADPNIKDQEGKSPLSFALGKRSLDKREVKVISLLLERGADPNIKDQEGNSLFYYVIDSSDNTARYKAVELLLDKGVDPNMQDDRGRASLHYLCKRGYCDDGVKIAKLLLRRGADPDLKDKNGKKPIDHVNPYNDVGKLFGAVNYEKAAILGIAALLTTTCSIALVYLAMNVSINMVQTSCFVFAAALTTAALCCTCYAVKTLFFSPGPLSEFTEAREEFLNSQKIAGTA
ncbi:MAG: ankyrin repeat domain-containing protein [Wolbachia sp.]